LFDEATRNDDKTALQIASGVQVGDEQTGHGGFHGAGIVGE
jgi:hypothetical protein